MTEKSFTELLTSNKTRRSCNLSMALQKMKPEVANDVKTAVGREDIRATTISKALHEMGYAVSEGSIRRCRRILCPCWKIIIPSSGMKRHTGGKR